MNDDSIVNDRKCPSAPWFDDQWHAEGCWKVFVVRDQPALFVNDPDTPPIQRCEYWARKSGNEGHTPGQAPCVTEIRFRRRTVLYRHYAIIRVCGSGWLSKQRRRNDHYDRQN